MIDKLLSISSDKTYVHTYYVYNSVHTWSQSSVEFEQHESSFNSGISEIGFHENLTCVAHDVGGGGITPIPQDHRGYLGLLVVVKCILAYLNQVLHFKKYIENKIPRYVSEDSEKNKICRIIVINIF